MSAWQRKRAAWQRPRAAWQRQRVAWQRQRATWQRKRVAWQRNDYNITLTMHRDTIYPSFGADWETLIRDGNFDELMTKVNKALQS